MTGSAHVTALDEQLRARARSLAAPLFHTDPTSLTEYLTGNYLAETHSIDYEESDLVPRAGGATGTRGTADTGTHTNSDTGAVWLSGWDRGYTRGREDAAAEHIHELLNLTSVATAGDVALQLRLLTRARAAVVDVRRFTETTENTDTTNNNNNTIVTVTSGVEIIIHDPVRRGLVTLPITGSNTTTEITPPVLDVTFIRRDGPDPAAATRTRPKRARRALSLSERSAQRRRLRELGPNARLYGDTAYLPADGHAPLSRHVARVLTLPHQHNTAGGGHDATVFELIDDHGQVHARLIHRPR